MPKLGGIFRRRKTPEKSNLTHDVSAPLHSDWSWRPALWASDAALIAPIKSGEGIAGSKVFHDCPAGALSVKSNGGEVEVDLKEFGGGFASLVFDLPEPACAELSNGHLLRLEVATEVPRGVTLFGRLNLRQGPNCNQVLREFMVEPGRLAVDFDLVLAELEIAPVDGGWVDLIIETRGGVVICIADLSMSRRPRAAL